MGPRHEVSQPVSIPLCLSENNAFPALCMLLKRQTRRASHDDSEWHNEPDELRANLNDNSDNHARTVISGPTIDAFP